MKPVTFSRVKPGQSLHAAMTGLTRSTASFKAAGVRQVGYVPDAGHKRLIELCQADPDMRAVVLTPRRRASASPPAPGSAASAACC